MPKRPSLGEEIGNDWSLRRYRAWQKRGIPGRANGPAKEFVDGSKEWYTKGYLNRLDGPAVETLEGFLWYLEGKLVDSDPRRCILIIRMIDKMKSHPGVEKYEP